MKVKKPKAKKPKKHGMIKNSKTGLVEVWVNGKMVGIQG